MTTNSTEISKFRRLLPQILATLTKDLILFTGGIFSGTVTLIIPALLGITTTLHQDEPIRITGAEASWVASIISIGQLCGGFVSGFFSDAFGRRMTLLFVLLPILGIFIVLGTAQSFWLVCISLASLSFMFGFKNAASAIYVSEISEKSIRGVLLALSPICANFGGSFALLLGSFISWRQIALAVSALPVATIIAIYFIPETPSWLLSKNRPADALKSLKWLRGWVHIDSVGEEFTNLKNHNAAQNTCGLCSERTSRCEHLKSATFWENCKELKQKRILKPFMLVMVLGFSMATSGVTVWGPYLIQVVKAHGVPLDANLAASILSGVNLVGTFSFLFSVKVFGKRRLFIISSTIIVLCCIGLSIYGFVLLPPNWTSFKNPADPTIPDFDRIRNEIGKHGYVAFVLLVVMNFFCAFGFENISIVMISEVFPLKLRSVLCGIATTFITAIAAIATKLYYDVELWLTLPGAILFYGMITLAGLIVAYFILPETENRSLEDIEEHFADDTKKITDIHIPIRAK